MTTIQTVVEHLKNDTLDQVADETHVYTRSVQQFDNTSLVMIRQDGEKFLLATGESSLFDELEGKLIEGEAKLCPLTHENRLVLNRFFAFTKPVAFGKDTPTMGLGDRLGLASPGHIEALRHTKMKPILAQQSIRELTLTNRKMTDIVDAASYAVFQEGYTGGFGADGDHLKEEKDIAHALSIGMSMITLDCSDYIPVGLNEKSEAELTALYEQLPEDVRAYYEAEYLAGPFTVDEELTVTFDPKELMLSVLTYHEALKYMVHVYEQYVRKEDRAIDFEISIDETETITTPSEHFFVSHELTRKGVQVISLAPRFCGEFQKGIDYIGDIVQFEKELKEHALIAKHFDYKLSIHSGSDKFKVFPIIAKHTEGIFHIKTAGTNWLEAIRIIARKNPNLYRKMHVFALENFEKAQAYYHVTPDLNRIAPLNDVADKELEQYMNDDAARQLFHITYGLLLMEQDEAGQFVFRDAFFDTLSEYEDAYFNTLLKHIYKHLILLNF